MHTQTTLPVTARSRSQEYSIPHDFLAAVQAAKRAKTIGLSYRHQYAKVAEAVLVQVLPTFSSEIRTVGARKGKSAKVGKRIASDLSGPMAAAVAVLWSIRNARKPGIRAVFEAAAHKPGFGSTMVELLGRTEVRRLASFFGFHGPITP